LEKFPLSSKILIVEDNPDTRDLLALYLRKAGFLVVIAVDGQEGLSMAKAEKPDAILTDLMMPNLDGLEMVRRLRSDADTARIPIVIATAHGKLLDERFTGADQVILKPFDLNHLARTIKEMILQSLIKQRLDS
jgi:twitching motility two-component system response regulator PilH